MSPKKTPPNPKHQVPKQILQDFQTIVEVMLDCGKNSQELFQTLQDCLNNTQHPNNSHNEQQNLLRTGKTLRKNRSVARALTENGSKNNILKKTKLNIELLNDQLLNLQTQGKNFSLEETAKFSRVVRALSQAAKNDLAMHNAVENNIKLQQTQKLQSAQKQGTIDQKAMNKAMQILGLGI